MSLRIKDDYKRHSGAIDYYKAWAMAPAEIAMFNIQPTSGCRRCAERQIAS